MRAVSDEDAEVVAWAAYGLGFSCKKHEKETVSALAARAVTPIETSTQEPPRLDAWLSIARAIGKCAADESEPTLVAWLSGPRAHAVAAAIALGDVATAKSKLREETLAALLNLAAGSAAAPPVPEALYAVGRLDHVPPSVVDRLREVATGRLAEPGPARFFAVRALGRANEDAAVELQRVLTTPDTFTFAERAEAARSLKKMPKIGLRLLGESLGKLTPSSDPVAITGLVSEDTGVLLTTLEAIDERANAREKDGKEKEKLGPSAKKALAELAGFSAPKGAPAPILRRVSWIRCLASKALAGSDFHDKALAGCDIEPPAPSGDAAKTTWPEGLPATTIGGRAMVDVIGRAPIVGPRLAAFRAYAEDGELRAREAAIDLLGDHDEVKDANALLEKALTSKSVGLIGTAAEVLTKHPQRASVAAKAAKKKRHKKGHADAEEPAADPAAPSEGIVNALVALVGNPAHQTDPELVDGVVDAVGALAIQGAKARLTELCRSAYPTTREHAEKALGLLGDKTVCAEPPEGGAEPVELQHLVAAKTKLDFETDAGAFSMELDPAFAPVAVTRFVGLARTHFYDGIIVHRVVPGFVTQFGAPDGDGSGGPKDLPALRCETSPLPFELGAIGVALAGRDTGSSQLFVMHAAAPHLDGQYALVGHASGAWGAFVDGDRIRKVTISP